MDTRLHGPISKKAFLHTFRSMENRINREQSGLPRLPLLRELELALTVTEQAERNAIAAGNGDMWYRNWKRSLDIAEQIAIVRELQRAS